MAIRWDGDWVWSDEATPKRNAFVRFRRMFDYTSGAATLHLTADARYVLYVNGVWIGQGPVRAWPGHWRYDSYDLTPYLHPGKNVIAVRVLHYGDGTFQYIIAPPGLLAQLEMDGQTIVSDANWKASPDAAFVAATPRIGIQQGFEEQYDARLSDDWTVASFDDTPWRSAVALRPALGGPHQNLEDRAIPFLTAEPILPQRIVKLEVVRSISHRATISIKPYLVPNDLTTNYVNLNAYVATQIWSPENVEITLPSSHGAPSAIKINGALVKDGRASLKAGWNSLLGSCHHANHLPEYVVCIDGPETLKFSARGDAGGAPWAVVGPFALNAADRRKSETFMDLTIISVPQVSDEATSEEGERIWEEGLVEGIVNRSYFQEMRPEHLPLENVFVQAYTDKVVAGEVRTERLDGLLSGSDWTTVFPDPEGRDVRILLDFGREIVGPHKFEIIASEGTILDTHNFEFIQPDGLYNFAEGMNNSFRYICREGRQSYQTYLRRGFQYSYLILRNLQDPVKIKGFQTLYSSYPQSRRGTFASSDAKLDRIWQVGADTMRACAEDTYTDCPSYEQVHWVGDARNEALVDWVVNGDPRLWYRCLEQVGQSLDRSPLTEAQVPSSWQNIIPVWSFLWMRSCREYMLFTGDRAGAARLLKFVARNIEGVATYINAEGLFDIHSWNLFDWAPMDTPNIGVVTHQNCMAVLALRDAAELSDWLDGGAQALAWRKMADTLSDAINKYLWNEETMAYTDCLRDGAHSKVYSQQTQTVALMSGVASGARAERCREIIHSPPDGFVRAGSPFFEFFLLESFQLDERDQDFVDTIRKDWGFMIDMGATTFWEMWSGRTGRLTRSHCHGWSSAPTYFLATHVLGVHPLEPGFKRVAIEPHPADLTWCRGSVPTPHGNIHVQWENPDGKPFVLRVTAPEGVEVVVKPPR
ncbi:MAG: family 78 glycoside hydrolase catalytic domain [Capsulimonas sp.]|uniref:family 78 glycoside hydrolase catalytic domain n=1 Tax=Capsulimonas sp. TaxID=2494211 RepID=UPI003263937C